MLPFFDFKKDDGVGLHGIFRRRVQLAILTGAVGDAGGGYFPAFGELHRDVTRGVVRIVIVVAGDEKADVRAVFRTGCANSTNEK